MRNCTPSKIYETIDSLDIDEFAVYIGALNEDIEALDITRDDYYKTKSQLLQYKCYAWERFSQLQTDRYLGFGKKDKKETNENNMKKSEIDYKKLYEDEHDRYEEMCKMERMRLEQLASWYGALPDGNEKQFEKLEEIFPELRESEDEKMINFIANELMCLRAIESNSGGKGSDRYKEITNAIAWIEKQGEQKSEERVDNLHNYLYGEQKSTDKVEPKFKVGEWVVCCDYEPEQIIGIKNNMYELSNGDIRPFYMIDNNHNIRPWTIQDAREGDVLADDYSIIIFRKIGNETWSDVVDYYVGCKYKNESGIVIQSGKSHYGKIDNVDFKPATKEQRDFLFTKMKEDGYEWDAYNKVLRKIEQKPQTELPKGEDYAIDGLWQAIQILEHSLGEVDGWQSDDGILEHKCAIEAVKRLYEHKSAWSEEDEKMFNSIIEDVMPCGECPDYPTDEEREYFYEGNRKVDWLKSFKDRMAWRPTEEQMESIARATNRCISVGDAKVLLKLYEDLKKL